MFQLLITGPIKVKPDCSHALGKRLNYSCYIHILFWRYLLEIYCFEDVGVDHSFSRQIYKLQGKKMSVVTPYLLLLKDRVHKRHQVFQSCEWGFAHQLLSPMQMQIAKEYLEISPNSHQITQKIKIYIDMSKEMPQVKKDEEISKRKVRREIAQSTSKPNYFEVHWKYYLIYHFI